MKTIHIVLLRRRYFTAAAVLAAAAAIFWAVQWPAASVAASGTQRQLPIYSVERADKRVAISFDAAWGNEDTQTLIDILGRSGVKATFFVVGDWVEKYPDSVRALHAAGHEVMSHSLHHDHYNALSADAITADVSASCDCIEAVTGVRPMLIRCPYGEYDDHVISAIRALGMEPIQWDVDSLDWKDYDAQTIFQRVKKGVQPGSIVLFHNAALHTPEALPLILDYLAQEGYTVVPVSELILPGPYTIDHTGRQHAAQSAAA